MTQKALGGLGWMAATSIMVGSLKRVDWKGVRWLAGRFVGWYTVKQRMIYINCNW
jgi:hypothetical protein